MTIVYFYGETDKLIYSRSVQAIHKEPGRTIILNIFASNPKIKHMETNVRRYTLEQIYGEAKGE